MRGPCRRWRHALAAHAAEERTAPEDRPNRALARHLAACPACTREFDGLRAMRRGLAESLVAAEASDGFADAVWERLSACTPGRGSAIRAVAVAVAFCGLIAVLVRPVPPLDMRPQARSVSAQTAASAAGRLKTAIHSLATASAGLAASPSKKRPLYRRRLRFARVKPRPSRQIVEQHRAVVASKNPPAPSLTGSLVRLAFWYECRGDYQSASAAYGQAARERPTDSLLFDAGRTSECAGDVERAVEFYARMLKRELRQDLQPRQDSEPRRGTRPWNENSPSV